MKNDGVEMLCVSETDRLIRAKYLTRILATELLLYDCIFLCNAQLDALLVCSVRVSGFTLGNETDCTHVHKT